MYYPCNKVAHVYFQEEPTMNEEDPDVLSFLEEMNKLDQLNQNEAKKTKESSRDESDRKR